ncbi:hypothetical protein Oter_3538 [Opitutus terrae PB90-1]|uniref:Restriction endonuclease type IV Mrr domain-containing protein n=2 Tax=Opitutus terrae TaxID=107709 RepID=B1ZVE8_OPITP|nr:hypothetical protein Oter_3538 [Opitutus terrae PB90-1]
MAIEGWVWSVIVVLLSATPAAAAGRSAQTPWGTEWMWVVGIAVLALIVWQISQRWLAESRDDEEEPAWRWDFTEVYPYYTTPPPPETIAFELSEPRELTVALLRQLEWKRLEELVGAWYAAQGIVVQATHPGTVGGSNLLLYRGGEHRPFACVTCSPPHEPSLNIRRVRELAALMASTETAQGTFISAGEITPEVRAAAGAEGVERIDGPGLVARFAALRVEDRDRILHAVLRDDYRTPTCPNCGVKMELVETATKPMWRCPNFPRCQRRMAARSG